MKYNILFLITVLSLQHLVYAQENINQKFMSEKLFANGKEYTFDAIESIEDKVPTKNFKTKSTADWQTIMTEDFEGTFPSGDWNVYFNDGYTNAYWGKTFFQTSQVAWCAAAGTQASTWENGYLDNMRTWMIYGPFDLSDATDATLEFQYFNSSEQDFDYFKWFASTNGSNFFGYQVSGYSSNYQFTTINFDLKSIPTLGNVTGNSNVYIAFLFESDSTVVDFEGAFVDSISLRKFVETSSSIPTVTTNSATNVTENSATLNGTVNPNNSSTTVIFEYGTDNITPESIQLLDYISSILKEKNEFVIKISSYSEYFGNPLKEFDLCKLRVKKIKEYFVKKGINEKRIELDSKGQILREGMDLKQFAVLNISIIAKKFF